MASNINQFNLEPAIGEIAGSFIGGENIISCIYNPDATSTNRLIAGESVKLANPATSEATGNIYVDERATELEAIFGTVIKSAKQKEFKPGDAVKIAVSGAIMRLKASGALNRGVAVTPVLATPGSVKAVSTKAPYGVTLDKIADTAIGRVWIQADAITAGTA
jgi:hypothetical protein